MKAVILFLSCICLLPLTLEAHEEGGHHNHHISNPEEEQQRRRNNRKGRPSWDKREVLENDDTPMLQPGCKTTVSEEHKEMMARAHEEYEEQNRRHLQVFTEVTIPVRFHVIKFNETVGDLDPLDVSFFMASLKFAFGSSGFKFNATSVNHYVKPLWYNCGHNNFFEIKSFSREGGADTLNVWICNLRDPEIVAQGTWPPEYMNKKLMDGVVARNPSAVDTTDLEEPNSFWVSEWEERTLIFQGFIHQVGHWLGLLDTHEGQCSGSFVRQYRYQPSYFLIGDGVQDTAAHKKPVLTAADTYTCGNEKNPSSDLCPNNDPFVDAGVDPWDNYMNHLSGYCSENYGRFTQGQIARMQAQYMMFRNPNTRTTTNAPSPLPRPTVSPRPTVLRIINYPRMATKCIQGYQSPCLNGLTPLNKITRAFRLYIRTCGEAYEIPDIARLQLEAGTKLKRLCGVRQQAT